MKSLLVSALSLMLVLAAGCASTDSRIKKNQALFDSFPADVQQQIRTGDIRVGFTPEMVKMSLGDPARTYTRTTAQGAAEVWSYDDDKPAISLGLGIGSSRGSTGVGGGVVVGGDRFRDDEKLRVVFEEGKVTSVERNTSKR